MQLGAAIFGGASVGVPGTVRLLEAIHKAHGRLPWARLLQPAIRLAEQGFRVSPRLNLLLRWYGAQRFALPARNYFFDVTGSARPIGQLLKNPELAATLRAIAEKGAGAFYEGAIAQAIVDAVGAAPNHQGNITLADLAGYRVKARDPVCFAYRGNRVCSMGPPSSGALAVGQVLKLVEAYDLGKGPADAMNGPALHLLAEAEKLAFADRDRYIGDPDFVSVPIGLLDPGYLAGRRALINPAAAMEKASAGTPPQIGSLMPGADETVEQDGTSHISIVDRQGNAIAMTTTIESGLRLAAVGGRLPAQQPDHRLRLLARRTARAAAGQRGGPRQAAAQLHGAHNRVRRCGKPWAVLGSPGGSHIILYVVKTLVALIDWRLDAQQAVSLMNFGSRGGPSSRSEIDHRSAAWHALKMKPCATLHPRRPAELRHARDRGPGGWEAGGRRRPAARRRGARETDGPPMQTRTIIVVGAGITGLWQALTLARRGHRVRLVERSTEPFADAASAYAGAMLGPFCETEVYAPVVRDLGLRSIGLWRETFPGTVVAGTLVRCRRARPGRGGAFRAPDRGPRSASTARRLANSSPTLPGASAPACSSPRRRTWRRARRWSFCCRRRSAPGWRSLRHRLATGAGGTGRDGHRLPRSRCARGAARTARRARRAPDRAQPREIGLRRPVRLLHPRQLDLRRAVGDGLHMVGATVIESDDTGPVTVRSALELLGTAYALHPAFGEAEIVEVGRRRAPRLPRQRAEDRVRGRTLHVNGLYRHGFLLAPALAELVAAYLETGATDERVFVVD